MRLTILKFGYLLILVLITFRLYYWQILKFDDLSALADTQHLRSVQLEAPRGNIYAVDGSILATNQPTFELFGEPKLIKNKNEVAGVIAKIIYLSNLPKGSQPDLKTELNLRQRYIQTLSQNLFWVSLQKGLNQTTRKEIEKLNITGVGFDNQLNRYYPESSSSAHLLGFVGLDAAGKQVGYFGLEGYYNGDLKGISGLMTEEKDAQGQTILIGQYYKKEAQAGHNLTLNIDRTVQYLVEKRLKNAVTKYGAKSGSVVIMNPDSGAVVAMASFPNYDPNDYNSYPKDVYKNPIVADSYEPGSTFKVLVMAAALNEGLVKPETKCDICSGPINIGSYYIKTWNDKYVDNPSMEDVIIHSDNTGMVFVGRKLGLDKLYQYLLDFGIGYLTNIDLQDESSPDLRPKSDWHEIDLATASFGQGIATTPIQIIRAVSAIANGGFIMEPHIVSSISIDGKSRVIQPRTIRQVISKEAAGMVTKMMVDAVQQGEAKVFAPKGYLIAGKTGTAQIPVAGHYDPNKTIASFVGFAPADNPKFVMLVRFQEPSVSIFGAETAAPTFFEIAKDLFTYYNIPPQN